MAMPAMAQETYESATIATTDLNGTARYVGMGGAMEALGADISTISTNPAGIGLMRRSSVCMSGGAYSTKGDSKTASEFLDIKNDKTPMSFDQIGFVYANELASGNFINFALNYNKSRNFNQILTTDGAVNRASQNKVLYNRTQGTLNNYDSNTYSQSDWLYMHSLCTENGDQNVYYNDADRIFFAQDTKGYISNFNASVSGNSNDRVYWGFALGFYDVNYSHSQAYSEDLVEYKTTNNPSPAGIVTLVDERKITGQGFDIKAGIIFRPIAESPLRIGFSIATPTFYELTSGNSTILLNEAYTNNEDGTKSPIGIQNYTVDGNHVYSNDEYTYKMNTPWKFGASLGYTIGNNIALGASYEYADYTCIDNRYISYRTYNDYYGYEENKSESDNTMNRHTENTLCGVSTIKLGAEYRPIPELAIRAGYNYVAPMYQSNGIRNLDLGTDGCYFASTTNWTNWKATNRFTCGVGFNINSFNIDVAYQHSSQKGDFHPFQSISRMCNGDTNIAPSIDVNNNHNQFLITLGYRF